MNSFLKLKNCEGFDLMNCSILPFSAVYWQLSFVFFGPYSPLYSYYIFAYYKKTVKSLHIPLKVVTGLSTLFAISINEPFPNTLYFQTS
jgi:hypothetical protein